jgi:tetratricopeptide (TPR) repeat protein
MIDLRSMGFDKKRYIFAISGLCLLVAAIFSQAVRFDFINLDDNIYVYGNSAISGGLNLDVIRWAFTNFWSANWHPLTWISHALDVSLFGMNPSMHHLVNIIFHAANSILAFIVFRKMTGRDWESLAVAALFAVHPTHVESVAWIAERKDVLSTFFWLLTMWAYVRFTRTRSREEEDEASSKNDDADRLISFSYFLVIVLFALGLMAKPMLVTLPFALLLCDFWPLGRLRSWKDLLRLIVEKIPLFILSAAASIVTFFAQRSVSAVVPLDALPVSQRLGNTLVSYVKYIVMLFYPADLGVLYPYEWNGQNWEIYSSLAVLLAVTVVCLWQLKKRPFLLFGWLWFLGTLVPVIGIVQVGSQALADRYTYIPYFGLFVMIIWGASSLVRERGFGRYTFEIATVVAIAIFAVLAVRQASLWRNNETLYTHTLAVTTNNHLIAHNLCHYYMTLDRLDEAEPLCRQAVEINPQYTEAFNTLGVIQIKQGRYSDAEQNFRKSIELAPTYVNGWLNLSQSLSRQGKAEEAEQSFQKAIESNGGATNEVFSSALNDLANALGEQGNYDKAAKYLRQLIELQSDNADAHVRLGRTLYEMKRFDDATSEVQNALAIKPDLPEAWNTLGLILLEQKRQTDAADAFKKVLNIRPDFPDAENNLAKARGKS